MGELSKRLLLIFGASGIIMLGTFYTVDFEPLVEYPQLSQIASNHRVLNELGVEKVHLSHKHKSMQYSFEVCKDECFGPYTITGVDSYDGVAEPVTYFYFYASVDRHGKWSVTGTEDIKRQVTPEQAEASFRSMLDELTSLYKADLVRLSQWSDQGGE